MEEQKRDLAGRNREITGIRCKKCGDLQKFVVKSVERGTKHVAIFVKVW